MKIENEDRTLSNTMQHSNSRRQQTRKVVCLQSSVTTTVIRMDHRISPIPPTSTTTSTSRSTITSDSTSSSFSLTTNNSPLSCKRKLLLSQSSVVFILGLAAAISVSNMNALAFSSRGNRNNMNHYAFVNHKHYALSLQSLHNQYNNQQQHNQIQHQHRHHLQPISKLQTRNSLISTTKTTTTSLFAESTGQQEGKSVLGEKTSDDDDEWNTLVSAFKMYKAAYGDLKVPSRFVVPSMPPWPSKFSFVFSFLFGGKESLGTIFLGKNVSCFLITELYYYIF